LQIWRKSSIFADGMRIERWILRLFGWKVVGVELIQGVAKSVMVMAPHTAYRDAVIGRLALQSIGLKSRLLGKKELFFFPMNIAMYAIGGMPIRGIKGQNSVVHVAQILKEADSLHTVICPEGGFAPTDKWSLGFLYMARRANVPVSVAYLDFKTKTAGIKDVIYDLDDDKAVMRRLRDDYDGVTAHVPEWFVLPNVS